MTAEKILASGLNQLGISMPIDPLMKYLALLLKWNKAYNLTAILEPNAIVTRHFLDSLAISPFIQGPRIFDLGSGGGFPGIPLALLFKDYQFVLLDSNGKKTRFLQEVKRQLKLDNVGIVLARAEDHQDRLGFDTVTCRAVTKLSSLIDWTKHLIKKEGRWVGMKGVFPEEELQALHCPYKVNPYDVPGLTEARCCITIYSTH